MIVRHAHIRLTRREFEREMARRADAWEFHDYRLLELSNLWLSSCEPVVETRQLVKGRPARIVGRGYESPLEVRGHEFSERIYTRRPIVRREDER